MGRNAKLQVEFELLIDVIDEYENIFYLEIELDPMQIDVKWWLKEMQPTR